MPPSKGKKPSKSFVPSSSPSTSRSTPPSRHEAAAAAAAAEEEEERSLRAILSRASAAFPDIISDSALVARIAPQLADEPPDRRTSMKLFLSEPAMLSASLHPGSLVSVSLPSSGDASSRPLEPFFEGFPGDPRSGEAPTTLGSFFAIATVFPSRKVLKNGARLSHSLSLAMGSPPVGKGVFISSLEHHQPSIAKVAGKPVGCKLEFCICKELHLRLVPVSIEKMAVSESGNLGTPAGKSGFSPRQCTSSPRTPSCDKMEVSSPLPCSVMEKGTLGMVSDSDFSSVASVMEDDKAVDMLNVFCRRRLCGSNLLIGNFISLPVCGRLCVFVVEDAKGVSSSCQENHDRACLMPYSVEHGNVFFQVNPKTEVVLHQPAGGVADSLVDGISKMESLSRKELVNHLSVKRSRLGGLSKEYGILKEIIDFSLKQKWTPIRYKGVLLHGPPGTGKTSLASVCAYDAGANLFVINGPEIVSEYYGESEQALMNIFDSARRATPSVIFIDELDALAPARQEGGEELSERMVGTLLTMMDSMRDTDGVLVIAATNRPDSIDSALRRPRRFDKEIEIGVPSPEQRLEILTALLDEMHHDVNEKELRSLAMSTHGFVGADLAALCNEAGMVALRRWIGRQESVDSISSSLKQLSLLNDSSLCSGEVIQNEYGCHKLTDQACDEYKPLLTIKTIDFENAKLKIRPSAMREVMLELPKVSWDDVGGQAELKKQLIEVVQLPQTCPDSFKRIGIDPPRGLLMFGPPGCSKTLMARAVASEAKLNFLAVKGPELFSKWVGESEKAVKSLFAKARENSPSIIFFDEIDGLATTRGHDQDQTSVGDRVLTQLLIELNELDQKSGVTVIAATNRPDKIDPAILRSGRFDRRLDVKPPNELDREAIFNIHMRNMPCGSDVVAKDLAYLTAGYTGADIKLVCREAALAALEESFEATEISLKHFQEGIRRVQPSDVGFYIEIAERFKSYVSSGRSGGL